VKQSQTARLRAALSAATKVAVLGAQLARSGAAMSPPSPSLAPTVAPPSISQQRPPAIDPQVKYFAEWEKLRRAQENRALGSLPAAAERTRQALAKEKSRAVQQPSRHRLGR
jgi:hypothetical protein